MRNYFLLKLVLASVLLFFICTAVSSASDSSNHITGYVVDINGNGVPGAKVSLFNKGYLAPTDSGNPAYTVDSGADIGMYKFDLSQLPEGDYQIVAEIDGKQSSVMLKVSENYSSFTAKTIALRNYAVSSVSAPQPATPTPTAIPTPAPTETANATVAPLNATATPLASSTPVPTPGISFTFIPALLVICLIALRKRN
jgi:hypothetical protein